MPHTRTLRIKNALWCHFRQSYDDQGTYPNVLTQVHTGIIPIVRDDEEVTWQIAAETGELAPDDGD